jgi:hypothetical protein
MRPLVEQSAIEQYSALIAWVTKKQLLTCTNRKPGLSRWCDLDIWAGEYTVSQADCTYQMSVFSPDFVSLEHRAAQPRSSWLLTIGPRGVTQRKRNCPVTCITDSHMVTPHGNLPDCRDLYCLWHPEVSELVVSPASLGIDLEIKSGGGSHD